MDKRLQLQADLKNGISPKLKQIGKDLQDVRRTPGMEAAGKWFDEFNKKSNEFVRSGGGAAGVINAIGIGGLTAAASLAGLVSHFKELGQRTLAMRELGREVGLSTSQVKALGYAAEGFGVSADKMQGMLSNLASQLPQIKNNFGDLHDELAHRFPNTWNKIYNDAKKNDFGALLKDSFAFLGQADLQKDPQLQKQMAGLFFGAADDAEKLFGDGPDGFMKSFAENLRQLEPVSADLEAQAKALRQASLDFNKAVDNLSLQAGPAIIKGLNDVLGEFNALFNNLDRLEKWWDKHTPRQMAVDVGKVLDGQLSQTPAQKYSRMHETGDFAVPKTDEQANARLKNLLQEQADLRAHIDDERKNHPVGFATRNADWIERLQDLGDAIAKLKAAQDDKPTAKPMSFRGGELSGGLQPISFGGFDEASGPLATGVKQGVLAAFREWAQQQDPHAKEAGGGGGFSNASFETWDDAPGSGGRNPQGFPTRGGTSASASASILDMIRQGETGSLGPESFRAITSQWHGAQPDITRMTVDQVLAFQREMLAKGVTDSAVGGFQINGTTLQDFKDRMHLSGSELFDPAMQTRIAKEIFGSTGGSVAALRGRWTSLNKQSDAAIRGAIGNGLDGSGSADAGAPGRAVDRGMSLHGFGRAQAERAVGSKLTFGEWCADFTNGLLRSQGLKGVNSSIANQFLAWGHEVAKDAARKGDVLVENRGRGVGMTGGHVGLFTGQTRMHNGHAQMEMLSGNYGDRVNAHDWVNADRLHVRRGVSDLVDEARKARQGGGRDGANGGSGIDHTLRAEIHLKDRSGAVQRSSVTASAGVVASMRRWPEPSFA